MSAGFRVGWGVGGGRRGSCGFWENGQHHWNFAQMRVGTWDQTMQFSMANVAEVKDDRLKVNEYALTGESCFNSENHVPPWTYSRSECRPTCLSSFRQKQPNSKKPSMLR